MQTDAHRGSRAALRRGYLMQFWAALYALTTVYPQPGLTTLVVVVLVLLAVLVYATRPQNAGGRA